MRRSLYRVLAITLALSGALSTSAFADASTGYASSVDLRVSTIRNLIESKDYTGAEKLALELADENPGLADAWMLLGYVRSVTARYDESNEAYERALEAGADRREVLGARAYNCRKLGDVELTRACYTEIVLLDPTNTPALAQLAAFEASVENYDAAAEAYAQALKLEPANVELIEAIAKVEEKRGNAVEARMWLETGLSADPTNARLLKRLTIVSLNAQDYDLAVGYADRALAVEPDDASTHRNRALALYQKGDKKAAIESFEKVLALGTRTDGIHGPLADCYRAVGRDADAVRVIEEGVAVSDQDAWLYSVWGKILEDQKRFDDAIAKFSLAVAARDDVWSDYARKQIDRQNQLKKREAMIASQSEM